MTVREYAIVERISLGTAYRRLWEGRARGTKVDGQWQILPRTPGGAAEAVNPELPRNRKTLEPGLLLHQEVTK